MIRPQHHLIVTFLPANVEFRDNPHELAQAIREFDVDVVGLNQATRAGRFLAAFRPSYRRVGLRFSYEARGIKALVSRRFKVLERKPIRMSKEWTGPKAGKHHEPRVYLALLLRDRVTGIEFWVLVVHWPTANNRDAQAESARAIRKFVELHPNRPVVVLGDFNVEEHELEQVAASIDGRRAADDPDVASVGKVDHVLYRDADHVRTRDIKQPSYAHGWGVVTLKIKENRR